MVKLTNNQKETIAGWLFVLPNIIGFSLLTIIPILLSLVVSFTDWNFLDGLKGMNFVGLENFIHMWSDDWFLQSIKNNFVFVVITVPASMIFALLAALAINKGVFLRTPLRLMIFMPYVSSIVAVSIVWGMLFHPTLGPINMFLESIGIADPPGWLSSSKWALPAIMIITVWSMIGYNMIIFLAGLQGIPKDLYEAATIDGAGAWNSFRSVTLPLLSPTTFFVLIINVIQSFQVFIAVFVMTAGGPGSATTVLTFYVYKTGFDFYKMGYASAMAWVLFAIIFFVTFIQWIGQKRWVHY